MRGFVKLSASSDLRLDDLPDWSPLFAISYVSCKLLLHLSVTTSVFKTIQADSAVRKYSNKK